MLSGTSIGLHQKARQCKFSKMLPLPADCSYIPAYKDLSLLLSCKQATRKLACVLAGLVRPLCCLSAGGGNALRDAVQLCRGLQQPADAPALAHGLLAADSLPRQLWVLPPGHACPLRALWVPAGKTLEAAMWHIFKIPMQVIQ